MSSVAQSLVAARAARLDWPFLIASVLALAVLVALVLVDGQAGGRSPSGVWFRARRGVPQNHYSFTASWRRLIVRGQADGFLGGLLLIAIAAAAIVPVAALIPGFGGAIAPIGPSLIVGAFVFGIGMQLANGCGSGTLYTVGGGSGRMLATLFFFIAGSVIGSLHLPAFLRARRHRPGPGVELSRPLGRPCRHVAEPWACRAGRRCHCQASRRDGHHHPRIVFGAILIGLLSIAVFARRPPSLERDRQATRCGARKIASAARRRTSPKPSSGEWAGPKQARCVHFGPERHLEPDGLGHDPGRYDGGRRRCRSRATRGCRRNRLHAAALGGLLMGWGARLGLGCNSAPSSAASALGSLHGWVWFAAALPGCMIGISSARCSACRASDRNASRLLPSSLWLPSRRCSPST